MLASVTHLLHARNSQVEDFTIFNKASENAPSKSQYENKFPANTVASLLLGVIFLFTASAKSAIGGDYQIFVSDEHSGDVTVIDGSNFKVTATIPVGQASARHPRQF